MPLQFHIQFLNIVFFQFPTQKFPKYFLYLDWYSRGDFWTVIKSAVTKYLRVSCVYQIWRWFLMKDLHAVSFLNLDKEAKINLTKIGINELWICPNAKTNLLGLVSIILSLSFALFFLRLSKIKCQESLEIISIFFSRKFFKLSFHCVYMKLR